MFFFILANRRHSFRLHPMSWRKTLGRLSKKWLHHEKNLFSHSIFFFFSLMNEPPCFCTSSPLSALDQTSGEMYKRTTITSKGETTDEIVSATINSSSDRQSEFFSSPPDIPPPPEGIPSCLVLSTNPSEEQINDPPQPMRLNSRDLLSEKFVEKAEEEEQARAMEKKESRQFSPSTSPREALSFTSNHSEEKSSSLSPVKQKSVESVSSSSSLWSTCQEYLSFLLFGSGKVSLLL